MPGNGQKKKKNGMENHKTSADDRVTS